MINVCMCLGEFKCDAFRSSEGEQICNYFLNACVCVNECKCTAFLCCEKVQGNKAGVVSNQ